jgi:hypothetical protein
LNLNGGRLIELSPALFKLVWNTGEEMTVTVGGDLLNYTIHLPAKDGPNSIEGLLGSHTGAANDFQLADGTVLPQPLASSDLYGKFANAWRIPVHTQGLFDYPPGENTDNFTFLNFPTVRLSLSDFPTSLVQEALALAAAAGITNTTIARDAALDYLVTGDPSIFTADANVIAGLNEKISPAKITASPPAAPLVGIAPLKTSVSEAKSGPTVVDFGVYVKAPAPSPIAVDFAVVTARPGDIGASAFAGGVLPSGTVTIKAGQTATIFEVDVPNGALGTVPSGNLDVEISNPTGVAGVSLIAPDATAQIINNQPEPGANPAVAQLSLLSNGGTLTQNGSSYTLDLGTLVQGEKLPLRFAVSNIASPPADSLAGLIKATSGSGFSLSNGNIATALSPGQSYDALIIRPDTSGSGSNSETFTFTPLDGNVSGYSAPLSPITLTITDHLEAPASASFVNPGTINFGNVRVGQSVGQHLTVGNTATAPAAALDAAVHIVAGGVTASGIVTQLAPGATDGTTLSVGINTTTAGAKSGIEVVDFASDAGNGQTNALSSSGQFTLTGNVYREAAASISPIITFVHVGDPGSLALSVANSDPADGFSENLIASVTGTTGNVGATTGASTDEIAAGASSNALTVNFSTAQAGSDVGTVSLALTSDGGTGQGSIDGLGQASLPGQTVDVNVTVNNFAAAAFEKVSGAGTFSGNAATGYTLDLGRVAFGAPAPTVNLGALNAALGQSDLLKGGFVINGPGASAFTNSNFGAFAGLGAGGADTAPTVTLNTSASGTFAETITLNATGYNAGGFSGALNPVTLTITGIVGASPDTWVGPPSKTPGTILGGKWTTAADWSVGVPGPSNNAILNPSAKAYTVTGGASAEVGAVTINGPSGAATATATLDITGGTLTVDGASSNAGTVKVEGGATLDLLGTLANTGSVSAVASGATIDLIGGSLSGGKVNIAAGALLGATGGSSSPSSIGGAAAVADRGILEATNHTTLTLGNATINASISRTAGVITGGIIEAADGATTPATIVLGGATINGGALETATDGVITTAAGTTSTLNGTTITPGTTVNVIDGSTVVLLGTIALDGNLAVGGPLGATLEASAAGATLAGHGTVTLSDSAGNVITAAGAGATLTNLDAIAGAGALGQDDGKLTLVNKKIIDATGTNALMIHTGNAITNSGALEATGTSELIIDDAVSNRGDIASLGAGSDVLLAGSVTNATSGAMVLAGASGALVELASSSVSGGRMKIVSGATIKADGGPSNPTTISGTVITDAGTLLAFNNTTLNLIDDSVLATGGIIEASDALGGASSTIVLNGTKVTGGTIETTLGGAVKTAAGTTSRLSDVAIAAGTTINIVDNSTLALKGTITNSGTLALNSTGDPTTLAIAGGFTLKGGGTVMMADVAPSVSGGTAANIAASGVPSEKSFTLTNVDNTIEGAGAIGSNGNGTLRLVNGAAATIDANGANALVIDTGKTITNAGLIEATGPGGLVIDDAIANAGTIAADGGKVTIGGNLTAGSKSEHAEIFSGNQLELKGAFNNAAVSFQDSAGDTGKLLLDHAVSTGASSGFKGTVAGFLFDGTNSDTLDLQDINFASVSWSFKENKAGTAGELSITDGSHTASIMLLGQYLAAFGSASSAGPTPSTLFQTAQDGTGGTLVSTTFK